MRYLFSLVTGTFLLFSNTVFSQRVVRKGMKETGKETAQPVPAKYTIDQLNGKWQETERYNTASENESFTDSLQLTLNNGLASLRDARGMSVAMKGTAAIEAPATLNVAGDSYVIKSMEPNLLVLQNSEHVRKFKKLDQFYFETVGKDSVKQASYNNTINTDLKNLSGKWDIYRRQAAPGFMNENTLLVKSVTFLTQGDNNTGTGEIVTYTSGANVSDMQPCTISCTNGQITFTTSKGSMTYNVYKADGSEFVFGKEDGVMNYAKK